MTSETITEDEENGVRLHLLLVKCNEALLNTFYKTFSSAPLTLYAELKNRYSDLLRLRKKKILKAEQWKHLFPIDKMTESKHFDISLLFILIRYLCPICDVDDESWKNIPEDDDLSEPACIVRIRNQRNCLLHKPLSVPTTEFDMIWIELSTCLITLGFHTQNDIDKIKGIGLDLKIHKQLKTIECAFVKEQSKFQGDIRKLKNKLNGVRWKISPNVNNFAGRDEDVEKLHHDLSADNTSYFGALLTGMGGVGKTELAKYYCNKYGTSHYEDNVIWIEADDISVLETSFFKVAEFLDIPTKDAYNNVADVSTVITKVYNFFADRKSLFVFDNLQCIQNLIDYLPTSIPLNVRRPTVLITSQFRNWSLNFKKVEIGVFSRENAELFIQKNLSKYNFEQNDCKILSDLTGNLPLALQQAISYIKRHHITISQYVELFQRNYKTVLKARDNLFYKHTVLTTWRMALEKLKETQNQIAMNVMFLISYANGKSINKNILLEMQVNEADINEALDDLSSYSLISILEKETYICISIHSLIQLVVRETAPVGIVNELLLLLRKQIKLSDSDKFSFGDIWLQHMINAFQTCRLDKELMTTFLELRMHIKQALLNKGKYNLYHTLFSSMFEKISPLIDSLTSYARHDLRSDIANSLLYCGKFEESKKIYEDMIKEQEVRIEGKSNMENDVVRTVEVHPSPISTNNEPLYAVSLNTDKGDVARIPVDASESTCPVNLINSNCRKNETSIKLSQESQRDNMLQRNRGLSKNAPIFLISYHRSHALCSLYQGKYNECSKLLNSVKSFILSFYGDLHPSLNDIDHLLALCLMKTGKYKEALSLFYAVEEDIDLRSATIVKKQNELYDIMKQEGMLPHPITIRSHIAKCLYKCKKYGKSLKIFQDVEVKRIELLGSHHPLTLQDRCNTATCIAQRFNSLEGIRLLREVEKKQIEIFDGAIHPQVLVTRYNIAKALLKCSCVEEALNIYRLIHQHQCDIYGETHLKARATWVDIQYCESKRCCCFRLGKRFDDRLSDVEFN